MRINTNVASLNTQRVLSQSGSAVAKSIGRLSSGFRINNAADDAAGLGIANKLRADIRSLKQASRNAEQANSMLQIAEGATQTIGSIVDRMKELATQAASDNVDITGRVSIKAEWDQLEQEITRIVDTTKFQGGSLLKTVTAQNAVAASVGGAFVADAGNTGDSTVASTGTFNGSVDGTITLARAGGAWEISFNGGAAVAFTSGDVFMGLTTSVTVGAGPVAPVDGDSYSFDVTAAAAAVAASGGPRDFLVSSSGAYTSDDLVRLDSLNLTTSALGFGSIVFADPAATTASEWRAALTTLDSAITAINSEVSKIGAAQNRIEFATSNVRSTIENMTAAESTIRDADMAAEMAEFTRHQILQQAGTAMLAQANAAPQLILRLLQ